MFPGQKSPWGGLQADLTKRLSPLGFGDGFVSDFGVALSQLDWAPLRRGGE